MRHIKGYSVFTAYDYRGTLILRYQYVYGSVLHLTPDTEEQARSAVRALRIA